MQNKLNKPLLAGVIGNPILHSKSPKLHNYWLKQYNINGYYIPIHVETKDLEQVLSSLIKLGFRGVNVTIPFKTKILAFADTITDRASIIGAANTLYFNVDGKITADNTDGYGFKTNLYHYYPAWKPKEGPAVVFGAGGAAKAIVHTLLTEGVPKVKILNRTKAKALTLEENFGNKIEVIDWYEIDNALKGAVTVVNTTSLGMIGQSKLKINLKSIASGTLVTDIVYNPIETDIIKHAKALGHITVDGLGMLLFQAELGFSNWFNHKPEINDMLKTFMLHTIEKNE